MKCQEHTEGSLVAEEGNLVVHFEYPLQKKWRGGGLHLIGCRRMKSCVKIKYNSHVSLLTDILVPNDRVSTIFH